MCYSEGAKSLHSAHGDHSQDLNPFKICLAPRESTIQSPPHHVRVLVESPSEGMGPIRLRLCVIVEVYAPPEDILASSAIV
ncbi:hypothetical protein NPIL_687811 [Nephila pilipes]|uniref:Uncharacterized protein n=1 Tax=Nephila pilipes TaxID=299642 RepID=A0A8X6NWA9_NEPPI|nr:hypothetical protein NPIL_687811 [Nephila pilipes]